MPSLDLEQPRDVRREPSVAVGVGRSAQVVHRSRHPVDVGDDVEMRTVREERAIGGVDGSKLDPVLEALVDTRERVGDQLRHRQDRGPGVEPVIVDFQEAGPAARDAVALENCDRAARPGQPQRSGQTAEPRADHDDPVSRAGHGAHAPTLRG